MGIPNRTRGVAAPAVLVPALIAAFGILATPQKAEAVAGVYLQLGIGYGGFSGDQLVVTELDGGGDRPDVDPERCCASGGLASQLRLGFSILGFGGPEFGFVGQGWDLGSDAGGAGMVGGGLRAFPLKFISLAGVDTSDFPIDVSLGLLLGYTAIGKDFAYTGTIWDLDLDIEYKLASFMMIGARIDVGLPNFSDFVFTNFNGNKGRCLDEGANQNPSEAPVLKESVNCAGEGPSSTFVSPQLVFTFFFDVLDV